MSTARVQSIDELVAQCAQARRAGNRADCSALIEQYPQFAPDMAEFLDDYDRVDKRFAPLREMIGSAANCPGDGSTLAPDTTAVSSVPTAGSSFGDYELLAEISRGGMGVIFKARQLSLNRDVALKMVLGDEALIDRQRFLIEVRAVPRLSHPHIVPIYEFGDLSGRPFFSMEYFSGGSLRERMDELRDDRRAVARLMSTVARAVEHAHRRGILHRDLKPSNILLDEHRQPHVADFGLAKRLDEESDITHAGAIVGTPSYMAPEQIDSKTDLSTAVDVYGLGAVLYELLTGRPPFKCATPIETMHQACTNQPLRPRESAHDIPPDLETICLKCLEKQPQARYSSAAAVSDDLDRWLEGKPIHSRKTTARERLVKWSRRQPLLAALAITIGMSIVGLLVLSGFLWQNAESRARAVQSLSDAQDRLKKIDDQLQSAQEKRTLAEKLAREQSEIAETQRALAANVRADVVAAEKQLATAQHDARHTVYAADMLLLHAAWRGENFSAASDLLNRYAKADGPEDLRGFEWHYLNRQFHGARLSWRDAPGEKESPGSIVAMAISPDDKLLATAQTASKLKLWNLADGRLLRQIDVRQTGEPETSFPDVTGLFFAGKGDELVAIVRTTVHERQMDWTVPAAAGAVLIASPSLLPSSSPTGFALAKSALDTASSDAARQAGSALFGQAIGRRDKFKLDALVDSLEFRFCRLADQLPVRTQSFDPSQLQSTVFPLLASSLAIAHQGQSLLVMGIDRSPDGRFLAIVGAKPAISRAPGQSEATAGGKLIIWDLAKAVIHRELESPNPLTAVIFSPDSATLAIGGSDGTVSVAARDSLDSPRIFLGHRGWVYSLRFTRDGSRLASGAHDGLVMVWDVAAAKELTRLRGHSCAVCRVDFAADGQTLVSGDIDGTIKVWDVAHANRSVILGGHQNTVDGMVFNAAGDQLTSADVGGTVRRWRTIDGSLLRETPPPRKVAGARSSASGNTIAWEEVSAGISMLVRDVESARQARIDWPDHVPIELCVSPDDRLLAAASLSGAGALAIWEIASSQQMATIETVKPTANLRASAFAFSPDCKLLAVATDDDVVIWDWKSGRISHVVDFSGGIITALAFSPDSRQLAAALADAGEGGSAAVHIWNLRDERLQVVCHGAGRDIASLAFSSDGRRLATGGTTSSQQGILNLWDTAGGREVFSEQFPTATITAVAFAPDGLRLAAAVTPIDLGTLMPGGKARSDVHVWDATPVMNNTIK